ncbi:LysR family transcriptional regulator [bacterium SCSIO 12643]|nr:LysR family transcriptional regulator [bacterium SCSIO 12643]
MHYTLHQLEIFLTVVDLQSITKAAEELHLTQPAISIQLKKLQEQFEIPLIEVIGRQLYVTDFGNDIAQKCRRIKHEMDEITHTVNQHKGLLTGSINISVVSTAKYIIPYFLKPFMDLHPGIKISIDVSNKTRVLEGLSKNKTDFSLISVLPEDIQLEAIELMENRLYLTGPQEFKGKMKKPKDLEKVTLLFREKGSATRNAMEKYLKSKNVNIGTSMQLVSNEAIKQTINAGIGFSIMPLIGLRTALNSEKMSIYPLAGLPITTQWHLVHPKGKSLSPAQKALIQFINDNKKQLVEEHFNWALNPLV